MGKSIKFAVVYENSGDSTGGGVKDTQIDRFLETAKALECDEDEARFKEKLGKIAKAKPTSNELPGRQK
jgi:hypothetical protein